MDTLNNPEAEKTSQTPTEASRIYMEKWAKEEYFLVQSVIGSAAGAAAAGVGWVAGGGVGEHLLTALCAGISVAAGAWSIMTGFNMVQEIKSLRHQLDEVDEAQSKNQKNQ
ncbi:MAG: hypothetical protein V1808_01105 [Candidatus Daviesbacteria bacterium]